jgi:hypothetical protein
VAECHSTSTSTLKKEAVTFPQNISKLLPEKKALQSMKVFFMLQAEHMITNVGITYLTLYMECNLLFFQAKYMKGGKLTHVR